MPNTATDYSKSTKRPGRLTVRSSPLLLLIHKVRRCLFSLFLLLFFYLIVCTSLLWIFFLWMFFLLSIFPRIYATSESFKKSFVSIFNSVSRAVRESWQGIPQREPWIRSHFLNVRYNTTPYHIIEISQMMNILLENA